jgi:hypothetical protein
MVIYISLCNQDFGKNPEEIITTVTAHIAVQTLTGGNCKRDVKTIVRSDHWVGYNPTRVDYQAFFLIFICYIWIFCKSDHGTCVTIASN